MADKGMEPVKDHEYVPAKRLYEEALGQIKTRTEIERGNNSGFEVAAQVADKILEADTIEGIIAATNQSAGSLEDLVGKPFKFHGYLRFNESADQYREGGTGFFVIFDVTDMNGNTLVTTTGATNIIFQLKAMEQLGYFSDEDWQSDKLFTIRCRVTGSGNTLYRLDFA
jgi:hypothetical protein